MTDISRKEFLKLSGAAIASGALASSGLDSIANAQSRELLHRPIHSTGEMIPAVGLGTASDGFGRMSSNDDYIRRRNAIDALLSNGGTVIDTSPTYRGAEAVVGRALDDLNKRDQCFLATKTSIFGKDDGIEQNARSYNALKTNSFDLLQVHNLKDTDDHLETINALKAEGKVRYVGITHVRSRLNNEAVHFIEDNKLDFIQCQYNMMDRSIENSVLPAAREHGVAVMINVPFARGRLFRAVSGKSVPAWANEFGVDTWGKFFLKFILSHPDVTVAIPGTINDYHVLDNLGALKGRLPTAVERNKMIQYYQDL
ncbi:MAG: aldo/keto reductase [Kordiimonadaceae bacterium]|nr:aldo/keto reductase [Kordiimonadaceae bacterium]